MDANEIGWNLLAGCEPKAVCRGGDAVYDADHNEYVMVSFGKMVRINVSKRSADLFAPHAGRFPEDAEDHLVPALLWYLATAQDLPLAGELVSSADIPGGQIFVKGTHVLPLQDIAKKFSGRLDAFIERGRALGGQLLHWGDAAVQLYPVPRVPVALVCWESDEDFPFKTSVLFDKTCSQQLPTDMLWSLSMAAVIMMIQ
jgi:hypothetical protein